MVDCGEGTQERLAHYKLKTLRISRIFISHLHGDHYLGLMGLIYTMHLLKRSDDLHIYGQRGLKEIISSQLKYSDSRLNYKIMIHELQTNHATLLFEDETLSVYSFPLSHRIPCCGFLFKEKPKLRRINKDTLPTEIKLQDIANLKIGKDILDENGQILYKNEELTLPPRKSRTYAFCSDTKYDESILPIIKNADVLYHEATFLKEKEEWAELTFHSTTHDAAQIAIKAGVGKLLLGHYSARYKDLTPFASEAQQIFKNAVLALEGDVIEIEE